MQTHTKILEVSVPSEILLTRTLLLGSNGNRPQEKIVENRSDRRQTVNFLRESVKYIPLTKISKPPYCSVQQKTNQHHELLKDKKHLSKKAVDLHMVLSVGWAHE